MTNKDVFVSRAFYNSRSFLPPHYDLVLWTLTCFCTMLVGSSGKKCFLIYLPISVTFVFSKVICAYGF